MSVAISLKVNDGVVLASDSAATLIAANQQGAAGVANVYNNANKICNLRKGFPVGAITWGSAGIGSSSISFLLKEFREIISGRNPDHEEKAIDENTYTVEEIAEKLAEFIYEEHYLPTYEDQDEKPGLGFFVTGYSHSGDLAEEYEVGISDGDLEGPTKVREKEDVGVTWRAQGEAIHRLLLGFSGNIEKVLEDNLGIPSDQIGEVLTILRQTLTAPLVNAPMPIQDAINLAEFLVDLTIKFSRYSPGAPTVGGAIEIASITKHEGFKWVERKHYYGPDLNPEDR